jgi:tRNA(fMet)-specific endonuclease VapC
MAFLLDTNYCFLLIARDARLAAAAAARSAEQLTTSVVVAGELRYGAAVSERSHENAAAVEDFLGRIDQLLISPATAQHYADLKSRLLVRYGPRERARRRGFDLARLGFTDNDLWIAASAIEHDAVLVSDDGDYGRITEVSDLRVETWLPAT